MTKAAICGVDIPTDKCNVHATRCKGSTFCGPSQAVLQNPSIEVVLGLLSKTKIRGSDALENVVVVLGGTEHAWGRVRDIPVPGEEDKVSTLVSV